MKNEHERFIADELNAGRGCFRGSDLVAIGLNIVGETRCTQYGSLVTWPAKVWADIKDRPQRCKNDHVFALKSGSFVGA